SAAAIYGVRAANGVILITTKKGEKGRPKVSLDASFGVQNPVNRYDVLNVDQYVDLYTDAFNNDPNEELPGIFDPSSPDYLGNRPTTDWQDAAINDNAVIENYGMRISGGSESTTYYLSGGYANQEGSLLEKSLERYSFAGNFTTGISDFIRAGVNYRLGYVEANDNTRTSIAGAARAAPWQPIFNPDGSPVQTITVDFDPVENPAPGAPIFEPNDDTFVQLFGPETSANFAGLQQETDNTYDILRNLGSAYLEVEPVKGLRFRGTLSADHYTNTQDQFIGFDRYLYEQVLRNPYVAQDGTSAGRVQRTITENWNLVKEFSINLTKQFNGVHNVDVLLNAMDQKYTFDATFAETGQTLSAAENLRILGGSNEFNQTGGALEQTALQGYMARVSYNYANKYYIDGTIRRDGSSRFAPDFRWGTFPSVAVAWRMTSEPFLQNSTFLDDLKLRAGWGQLGNQETAAFAFLSTISFSPDYAFGSGSGDPIGRVVNGVRLPNLPNTVLSWETAETFNIGFDAYALRNRLNFTVEYYNRLTRDIIQPTDLAPSVGNESSPILNVASVRNSGMEFVASFRDKIGKFSYGISGNFTTVNNEVVKLNNGEPTFGPNGGRIEEGEPLGYIFGYRVDRILRDQADVDAFYASTEDDIAGINLQPGDIAFQDIASRDENGDIVMTPDGIVNDADRVNLGSTIPSHYYGFNFDLGYGPFDASIFFQGVGGFQLYNGDRASFECMCGRGDNQSTAVLDRWTPDNRDASLPRAVVSSPGNSRVSDRFVEDAGFLRLRNFQLGYTLPRTVIDDLGFVQNFRVYLAGTNLLTLTNWTGIDPETQGSPPARSFVFGLNATF
ncbi:MAG: SusC/RagA family TonB-linked outer membrane protein, partial [Bacteroidota bacterium]